MGTPAPHVSCNDTSVGFQSNTSRYVAPGHTSIIIASAVSTQGETIWQTAGTWSGLWARIVTNTRDDSADIVVRFAGVGDGNQALLVPAGMTGTFQDLVNTDAVVAGDVLGYRVFSRDSVSTAVGFDISLIAAIFTATANERAYRVNANLRSNIPTGDFVYPMMTAETVYLQTVASGREDEVQSYLPVGTVRRASVLITIHIGGSGNTITFRRNEVDTSIVLVIPAGMTGVFSDLVNTVGLSDLDRCNWSLRNTASNNLFATQYTTIDLVTTRFFGGGVRGAAPITLVGSALDSRKDGFASINSWWTAGQVLLESQTQVAALVAGTWGGLLTYVDINGQDGACEMIGHLNGVDAGFTVTVPAGMTGLFIAVGAGVSVVATDQLSQRRRALGTNSPPCEFHQQNFWVAPGTTGPPRDGEPPYTPPTPPACPGPGDTGAARDGGIPYTP